VTERIEKIKGAIETTHKCVAHHVSSMPVSELFQGKVASEGVVETFALVDHPKAKHCYAWFTRIGPDLRYTTVLELPPVHSPRSAVKVAIAKNEG
jgi:hypothetical protein